MRAMIFILVSFCQSKNAYHIKPAEVPRRAGLSVGSVFDCGCGLNDREARKLSGARARVGGKRQS